MHNDINGKELTGIGVTGIGVILHLRGVAAGGRMKQGVIVKGVMEAKTL